MATDKLLITYINRLFEMMRKAAEQEQARKEFQEKVEFLLLDVGETVKEQFIEHIQEMLCEAAQTSQASNTGNRYVGHEIIIKKKSGSNTYTRTRLLRWLQRVCTIHLCRRSYLLRCREKPPNVKINLLECITVA